MLRTTPPSVLDRLRGSWRILLKEVAAFGVVGAVCFVIEIGLFNLLLHQHIGPMTSKAISAGIATAFAYIGNRHWSFSHRARTGLGRETSFFFGINLVALIAGELIIALFAYPLGYKDDHWVLTAANVLGIGLGTLFRFWAYKRFVFLHPDKVNSRMAVDEEQLAA
jgi:putative flippase GtrA